MTAYKDLMRYVRETQALAQIAGRLGWDQETMMPDGATHQRSEETAAIEAVLHQRRTDSRVEEWLNTAQPEGDVEAANIRLIRHEYERVVKIPEKLATEIARATSASQRIWAEARANDDFAAFAPTLEYVLMLKREEAGCLAGDGDVYDALLQDYEPGTSADDLDQMFSAMRPRLVALREKVLDKATPAALDGDFDEAAQMGLSRTLAKRFGYDFNQGRIDKAVHPFSSGSGQDVRITTRTNQQDPFNCIYSTIHEVGHAAYEQGIDDSHLLTPVGQGVSMGVHESQSRIYENQLGRSEAFTGWLFEEMGRMFGDLSVDSPRAFYAAVNRVAPGYIRTEADEIHYNLHILLRFDLERALIQGDLGVADLEAAWNDRFEADFGVKVDRPSNGVLQDVHWSVGLFGYFPTYTLGNVYAGCLHAALREAEPKLDKALAKGDTSPATDWLRENLQQFGGLRTPRATIEHACGTPPSEGPLLDYLEEKFTNLYDL